MNSGGRFAASGDATKSAIRAESVRSLELYLFELDGALQLGENFRA